MKNQLIFFCFLFTFLFTACEEDIALDFSGKKKLVLLSSFQPDSLFRVSLSTSIPVGSANLTQAEYPDDVQIQLFEEDQYLGDLIFAPLSRNVFSPYYYSNHQPQPGVTYSIKASHKDYPTITASNQIPPAPEIRRIELIDLRDFEDPSNLDFHFYTAKANVILGAQNSEPRYYHLLVQQEVFDFEIIGNDTLKYPVRIDLDVQLPRIGDLVLFTELGNLFSSTQLMGNRRQFEMVLEFFLSESIELKGPIYVELRQVSKDYYLFYKTLEEQDVANFRQGVLYDESILIHNNINGGIGNFGAFNTTIHTLEW